MGGPAIPYPGWRETIEARPWLEPIPVINSIADDLRRHGPSSERTIAHRSHGVVKGWQDFRFSDRAEAGRMLGAHLAGLSLDQPIVYALPRGGVPVALEVSRALKAPLDFILVRKIGAPGAPELALGALVDGASPQMVINEEVRRHMRVTDEYLQVASTGVV